MQHDDERSFASQLVEQQVEEGVNDKGLVNVSKCVHIECNVQRHQGNVGADAVDGDPDGSNGLLAAHWMMHTYILTSTRCG